MASTYCNLTQASGLKKLNDYLHIQTRFKRQVPFIWLLKNMPKTNI